MGFDKLTPEERRAFDREFDFATAGWENGLDRLVKERELDGVPLLVSGFLHGAQWAGQTRRSDGVSARAPSLEAVRDSPFVGDLVNETVFRRDDAEAVPQGQRVTLPDEAVARAWEWLAPVSAKR